ncbi:unnamed protein product [Lepeophtheirus salmonis]|uniref:(salmon louse) hypothetical protein n=1 Tax=Lepeophtheirus salmonis TaxID=72036 RepID=A0A7R8CGZ8_LEPSM|nr:unnamed protein product [Lepeophtheirus salmonis]CAF2775308.1 unnamed protein product [Lepeophtheirus salmonis]
MSNVLFVAAIHISLHGRTGIFDIDNVKKTKERNRLNSAPDMQLALLSCDPDWNSIKMSLLYLNGSFSLEEEHCSDGWSNNSLSTLSIEKNISTEESFCDRYWDNIACWPATKSGVTLAMPCNSFKAFMDLFLSTGRVQSDIKGFAYLKCNESGHWNNRTNYIECTNLLVRLSHFYYSIIIRIQSLLTEFPQCT